MVRFVWIGFLCPPLVLIPYKIAPETSLKDTNYLLLMLIPVPKNPTNDIDVYLQPLIDELGDLCLDGTLTYDDASI